jgi:hypothetical protein
MKISIFEENELKLNCVGMMSSEGWGVFVSLNLTQKTIFPHSVEFSFISFRQSVCVWPNSGSSILLCFHFTCTTADHN